MMAYAPEPDGAQLYNKLRSLLRVALPFLGLSSETGPMELMTGIRHQHLPFDPYVDTLEQDFWNGP